MVENSQWRILLIIAVVLAIVIAIGFIRPGPVPVSRPFEDAFYEVAFQPSTGALSTSQAVFTTGDKVSADGLAVVFLVNREKVKFCVYPKEPECPTGHVFSKGKFNATEDSVTAEQECRGSIWVYNSDGTYWLGFKEA